MCIHSNINYVLQISMNVLLTPIIVTKHVQTPWDRFNAAVTADSCCQMMGELVSISTSALLEQTTVSKCVLTQMEDSGVSVTQDFNSMLIKLLALVSWYIKF